MEGGEERLGICHYALPQRRQDRRVDTVAREHWNADPKVNAASGGAPAESPHFESIIEERDRRRDIPHAIRRHVLDDGVDQLKKRSGLRPLQYEMPREQSTSTWNLDELLRAIHAMWDALSIEERRELLERPHHRRHAVEAITTYSRAMSEGTRLEQHRLEALGWLDSTARWCGVSLSNEARSLLVAWLLDRVATCLKPIGGSLDQFPAAQQLVMLSIAAWRQRTNDLFAHLVRDARELHLSPTLVGVRVHGEGLHARGTTLGLEFGDGQRWFHRTRDRSMGAWFLDVCATFNAAKLSTPLHVRRLLLREGCSWDEGVTPAPCRDESEIRRYFVRAGMLVRLLERFAGVDFHARNVVGAGEYPVLVDVETLFVPYRERSTPAFDALVHSPLRAGLVGLNVIGQPGRAVINGGGLHPGGTVHLPFDEDGRPVVEEVDATIPAPLGDHVADLIAGWDEMEECLARVDLGAHLERAAHIFRRDLHADGRFYHAAMQGSLAPDLLASISKRERWLDALDVTPAERAALRILELPRPMTRVGEHPARLPGTPFTEKERARRRDLIRSVVALRDDRPAPTRTRAVPESRISMAVELGDQLLALRFAGSQWHGARWFPSYGARLLAVLGGDLHGGNAGIAIVYAMLARATGAPRFADAARATLRTIPDDEQPVLGAAGLGGAIYAFARTGEMLRDDSLVARARTYIDAAPRAAPPWDILIGVSGLLLGSLAVGHLDVEPIAALQEAHERGLGEAVYLREGVPHGLPDPASGVAYTLARCGHPLAIPATLPIAWRVTIDTSAIDEAWRELNTTSSPLDGIDLALALVRAGHATARREVVNMTDRLVEQRRVSGHWFPATSIAERHQMSIVDGLPGVIHALLAAEDSSIFSIRRME